MARIGGNLFDGAWNEVSLFINLEQGPKDFLNNQKVQNYYIGQANIYLQKIKEYMFGLKIVEYQPNNIQYQDLDKKKKFMMENWDQYEQAALTMLKEWEEDFAKTSLFNRFFMLDFFVWLGYVAAFDAEPIIMSKNGWKFKYQNVYGCTQFRSAKACPYIFQDKKFFLLPNETGYYGWNTCLYAELNGITIWGMPLLGQKADWSGMIQPNCFVLHDCGHSILFPKNSVAIKLYELVLKKDMDLRLKKLFILFLFSRLHESFEDDFGFGNLCEYQTERFNSSVNCGLQAIEYLMSKFLIKYLDLIDENLFEDHKNKFPHWDDLMKTDYRKILTWTYLTLFLMFSTEIKNFAEEKYKKMWLD